MDLLEEQADHLGRLVLNKVADDVFGGDHRLVAHRDDRADADAMRIGEVRYPADQRAALQPDSYRAR